MKSQREPRKNAGANKKFYDFGPSVQTNLILYNH